MSKYIISDPHILSGTPVIKGTRVPVERILYLFREGYTIEEIQDQYDHIDLKTLEKVLNEISHIVGKTRHDSKTT